MIDPTIRNITVSGRIASGTTTLAKGLSYKLGWKLFEGGELFEKYFSQEIGIDSNRPDKIDLDYENMVKKMLSDNSHQIIQSHLSGYDAQGIDGVYKILVVCQNENGQDATKERAKRLSDRKNIDFNKAIQEVKNREEGNLDKWRRLYENNNPNWVYYDPKYYDITVNTYFLNKEEALEKVLKKITIST